MKPFIALLFSLFVFSCKETAQVEAVQPEKTTIKAASEFYPKNRAQVLVVGTFHFDYPGLDTHKTSENDKIDVLKEPKKSEVTEVVEYIKRFNPTKIAIEASPGWKATEKLKAYKNGEYRDKRGERYQIAMRLASEINLDTLYEVNSYSLQRELYKKDSVFYKSLTNKVNWNTPDPYWDMAKQYLDHRDAQLKKVTILNYLKNMNTREGHNTNFGLYLTGSFATGDGQGADNLSMWWYNRNLRIFANIINISESPEDRILVVMGNGHAAILRQLFEASPQFDYVEFGSL